MVENSCRVLLCLVEDDQQKCIQHNQGVDKCVKCAALFFFPAFVGFHNLKSLRSLLTEESDSTEWWFASTKPFPEFSRCTGGTTENMEKEF